MTNDYQDEAEIDAQEAIDLLITDYRNGEYDDAVLHFPYTLNDIPAPSIRWFTKDECAKYGTDGFHTSRNEYESSPLWYAILDTYAEFEDWSPEFAQASVEHGGMRYENWNRESYADHKRYEDIFAEAHKTFITVHARASEED